MALFLLQESNENNKWKIKINNILNIIEEKRQENRIILELPIRANEKIRNKKIEKLMQKMEKYRIKTIILSKYLYNIDEIKSRLYSRNINILDGKYLFKMLIEENIYYICKQIKKQMEKTEISILINDISNINKEIIINLASKIKVLNIITNHINELKQLEDYLYNENGIIIKVSNNYKTAMQKTDIIVNIDFTEKSINKYSIPNKCIIININGRVKIKSKKFSGININDYNIIIPEKYLIKGYNNNQIYESYLINEGYEYARKQIIKDKIQIQNLIGEKGVISYREFEAFGDALE